MTMMIVSLMMRLLIENASLLNSSNCSDRGVSVVPLILAL